MCIRQTGKDVNSRFINEFNRGKKFLTVPLSRVPPLVWRQIRLISGRVPKRSRPVIITKIANCLNIETGIMK